MTVPPVEEAAAGCVDELEAMFVFPLVDATTVAKVGFTSGSDAAVGVGDTGVCLSSAFRISAILSRFIDLRKSQTCLGSRLVVTLMS